MSVRVSIARRFSRSKDIGFIFFYRITEKEQALNLYLKIEVMDKF